MFTIIRMLLALPHWRPCSQHLVSERWRFFNPLPAVIIHSSTFCFSFFLKSIEERRRKRNLPLTELKSQIRVSRPVVLRPCDCNRLKGNPCAKTDMIVLHSAKRQLNRSTDAIHPLVVTTRYRSVFRQQPQIRASFNRPTFGKISWFRPSGRCSHPKQNWPK